MKNIKRKLKDSILINKHFRRRLEYVNDQYLYKFSKTSPLPLNTGSSQIPSPFFIVGSGRSGNTLLRRILCNKDGLIIPPESYVLGEVIRKYELLRKQKYVTWEDLFTIVLNTFNGYPEFKWWETNLNQLYNELINSPQQNRSLSFIIYSIYLQYAESHNQKLIYWGDKTPMNTFNLFQINDVFPEAKYIHLIRDGRDVVNSYIKSGIYKNIEPACNRWTESIKKIEVFEKIVGSDKVFNLKYEELVQNTEEKVKQVCEFLDISFEKTMIESNSINLGDVNHLLHHKNVNSDVNTKSIGKWKKELDIKDAIKTEKMCNSTLKKLGYI